MPHLEIITAEGRRKVELVEAPVTIGRSKVCQCRVNDKSLSREHMEFRKKPDGWWIKDLGSRNKTFVNGLKVTGEMQLKEGDKVTAGRTVILFTPTPAQSAAAKPAGAEAGKSATPAAPASDPAGGWAPAPPVAAPSAPVKAAGEGTAPLATLAGGSGEGTPGWKKGLLVAVVLGGAFIAALVLYLLVFSGS
jgi:hypothetical protein